MKFLSQEDHVKAFAEFRLDWMYYHCLPIAKPLVARADTLACEHNLRGYDAIHLAAAINWQDLLSLPVTLVTYDKELASVARAVGMTVLPEKQ